MSGNPIETEWKHFIDGAWCPAGDGGAIELENPGTEEGLARIARATPADIDAAVAAARRAFASRVLVDLRPAERGRLLLELAAAMRDMAEEIALVECLDNGKPLGQARNEAFAAARYFTYYGGAADKLEGKMIPLGGGYVDYTIPAPFGVSAQIVPWNFPLQIAARGVACAIATGNTVVLKTPELSPLSCVYIAKACERVGLPAGTVNILCGYGEEAGAALVAHGDIDHIVFTGSIPTGQSILRVAADRVIPSVMELGGKSAAVIYPDAHVDQAVTSIMAGIFTHAGQVCSASSRLVVHADLHDELVGRLAERAKGLSIGPGIEDKDLGPLISKRQLDRVEGFVHRAAAAGAEIVTGGRRVDRQGHFMEPTIVAGVDPRAEIVQNEVFGPVLAVQVFREPEEAVALANGTEYGLCAGVHTRDLRLAHWTAERLVASQVFVNEWFAGGVETPFGGTKRSGFGREKGFEGLLNYVQTKNVCIQLEATQGGRPGGCVKRGAAVRGASRRRAESNRSSAPQRSSPRSLVGGATRVAAQLLGDPPVDLGQGLAVERGVAALQDLVDPALDQAAHVVAQALAPLAGHVHVGAPPALVVGQRLGQGAHARAVVVRARAQHGRVPALLPRGAVAEQGAQLGRQLFAAGEIVLVDHVDVRDFEDARLHGLHRIARVGLEHQHHAVDQGADGGVGLSDAHGLEHDPVEAVSLHGEQQIRDVVREPVVGLAAGDRADVEVGVLGHGVHAHAIAQDRASAQRAAGVDGEHAHAPATLEQLPGQPRDQRALAGSRSAGHPDAHGTFASRLRRREQGLVHRGVVRPGEGAAQTAALELRQGGHSGASPPVGAASPSSSRVCSPSSGGRR